MDIYYFGYWNGPELSPIFFYLDEKGSMCIQSEIVVKEENHTEVFCDKTTTITKETVYDKANIKYEHIGKEEDSVCVK